MGEADEHSGQAGADGDALLIEFLRERDTACPICDYNLRNLTGDVCPECGQRFELRVGAAAPRFGWFLLLLAPMFLMCGIALLFGLVAAVEGLPRLWGFYAIEAIALVNLAAAVWLYRKRPRLLRYSRRTRVILIALSWLIQAVVFIASLTLGTSF